MIKRRIVPNWDLKGLSAGDQAPIPTEIPEIGRQNGKTCTTQPNPRQKLNYEQASLEFA